MARILYYSVHEALEYDEITLFQSMGYTVFSLGTYCPVNGCENPFRPKITGNRDRDILTTLFSQTGCKATFNNREKTVLTKEFVNHFDIVIVMHDIHFIAQNWDVLKSRCVIWRTIGQAIDFYDRLAAPYRREGLHIVRWSPRELLIEDYIGHDAIIRAYKDPQIYRGWHGHHSDRYVTFSSSFKGRYASEYKFFAAALKKLDYQIGGGANEELPNAIGLLGFAEQLELLRCGFGYTYFHGSAIPYTLNFVEAWMTGLPVIVIDRKAELAGLDLRYNEINDFLVDGVNGFKVESPTKAASLLASLLDRRDQAKEVGRQGRLAALSIFGMRRAQQEWGHFFDALLRYPSKVAT